MLDFVQAPAPRTTRRIGTEASGIIEMEERGGLTVTESNIIADLIGSQPSAMIHGAKLAEAIATAEDITLTEAYKIIEDSIANRPLEDAANTIRLRHVAEIAEVHAALRADNRRTSHATVTALIRTRGNRPAWTPEETATLDRPLFEGIYQLALDEQDAEDMPASPPTEDDLKKPQPETPPAPKRTGTKSSGS